MCSDCSTATPTNSITRRRALAGAGATGVALLFAGSFKGAGLAGPEIAEAATATCALTPNKTIGPYFVDEKLNRSLVTSDSDGSNVQPGTPLAITMYLFDATNDCAPVVGAQVDIWHANYQGKYSDESANGTTGHQWLRGYQVTDSDGKVVFNTTWPGWYSGRAVHIHFRVRTSSSDFTSQMFFTDAMNATVFSQGVYAARPTPDVTDSKDSILGSDADVLTLAPTVSGDGYAADFSVGLSGTTSGTAGTTTGGSTTTTSTGIDQSTGTSTSTSTGTSTSDTADTVCQAALMSATATRSTSGKRHVRVRIDNQEAVTVAARLTRSGHRLATDSVTLPAGSHTLRLAVGSGVKAGAARLSLRAKDAAGNSKKFHRSVHVPARKA